MMRVAPSMHRGEESVQLAVRVGTDVLLNPLAEMVTCLISRLVTLACCSDNAGILEDGASQGIINANEVHRGDPRALQNP